ncbi:hypothetical protein HHI36_009699, partial [Cryptolaemus montrouzieri]
MNLLILTKDTNDKVFAHNTDEVWITRQERKSLSETKDTRTARNKNNLMKISFLKRRKVYCMVLESQNKR